MSPIWKPEPIGALFPDPVVSRTPTLQLGLRENWRQFSLLVLITAFVGAMIGLERAIVPLLAEEEFGKTSHTVILSFIVSFGAVKALANLSAGRVSDLSGRKSVLVIGWLFAIPVPFMVMFAPSWGWIVGANILLGVNQGLCWSTTVIMKVDLAGPHRRGLAMGLNEASGYLAVSGAALVSGFVAASTSLRPEPFYLGVVVSILGLLLSILRVQDTREHSELEASLHSGQLVETPSFRSVFRTTTWNDRSLRSVCQAGLANNLNDAMAWGLFPLLFAAKGMSLQQIGWLAAVYPGVWGLGQLVTGGWSDRVGRKPLIVTGMWLQALAILIVVAAESFTFWLLAATLLGVGTALVYPTLLAAIGDVAHPSWRATSIGVYRLWRDGGYAIGALTAGVVADLFGLQWSIGFVAGITFASGTFAAMTMYETRGARWIELPDPLRADSGV